MEEKNPEENDFVKIDRAYAEYKKYEKDGVSQSLLISAKTEVYNAFMKSMKKTRYNHYVKKIPLKIMDKLDWCLRKCNSDISFSKLAWNKVKEVCVGTDPVDSDTIEIIALGSNKNIEKDKRLVKSFINAYEISHGLVNFTDSAFRRFLLDNTGLTSERLDEILDYIKYTTLSLDAPVTGKDGEIDEDGIEVGSDALNPYEVFVKNKMASLKVPLLNAIQKQWDLEKEEDKPYFSKLVTGEYLRNYLNRSTVELDEDLLLKYRFLDMELLRIYKENPEQFPTRVDIAKQCGRPANSAGKVLQHFYDRVLKHSPELNNFKYLL